MKVADGMSQLVLHNAQVVLNDRIQRGGVGIREQRIADVFNHHDAPVGLSASEKVDLAGQYLAPGMIDIHLHGSVGIDVQNTDEEGLKRLSEFLLAEGVTGYFATFVPADDDGYRRAMATVEACIEASCDSPLAQARILGIHFEGPFVSEQRCGALQRRHFRTYDGNPHRLEIFIGHRTNPSPLAYPRLMTLAPEIPGGIELTRTLSASGVRVFMGHTQADPETLDRALAAGAYHITHFPNALDSLHHRRPGAVGWGLVHPEVTMDCIADFHHVHPLMLQLMHKAKSAARLALISDAIMPTGLGDGEYMVWGDKISVANGKTALVEGAARGAIAGSVITMREALKNFVSLGVPLPETVRMATETPARAAGIADQYGSIETGKRADLIVFDDNFQVHSAIRDGLVVR